MNRITLKRPNDYHTHLRSPAQVGKRSFRFIARKNGMHYGAIVVEPNTYLNVNDPSHHIETGEDVAAYRELVLEAFSGDILCEPKFLIKLTPRTTPTMIEEAIAAECFGLKLYPEGVTTGSNHGGVINFLSKEIYACLEVMQKHDLPLQIHPEMPGRFCLKREFDFHKILKRYGRDFPKLRIFVEHVTDKRTLHLVKYIRQEFGAQMFATVTGHHQVLTLDDVLGNVDHHCWPCAKFPEDRDEIVDWTMRGVSYVISITDSAPHQWHTKHMVTCACAGVFNPSEIAIPWLVTLAEKQGNLNTRSLERFWRLNGEKAYGPIVTKAKDTIMLIREKWTVPLHYGKGRDTFTPFLAGKQLPWRIAK